MPGFTLRRVGDLTNPTSALPLGVQSTATQLTYWRREGNVTFFLTLLGMGERLLRGETSANGYRGEGFFDGIIWCKFNGFTLNPYDIASDTGDYIFHKGYETDAALGYADPDQGRPHFFPELDFTFSGRPYIEGRLSNNLHDGSSDPVDFEVKLRTSCVWDYDALGNRIGPAPTFTSNVARHVAFACRRAGLNIATEFDWPSWYNVFRQKSDEGIGWALGAGDGLQGEYYDGIGFTTLVQRRIDAVIDFRWGATSALPSGRPVWTTTGSVIGENAAWTKTAVNNWGNAKGVSSLPIPSGGNGRLAVIVGAGDALVFGLTYSSNPPLLDYSEFAYGWRVDQSTGVAQYILGGAPVPFETSSPGDEFSFEQTGTAIVFKKNGVVLAVPGVPAASGDLYGAVTSFYQGSGVTGAAMDPSPAGIGTFQSVKWTGFFQATETGDHTFYVDANDGVKLIVNGTTLIDDLNAGSLRERSGTIALTANSTYAIELQYEDMSGDAAITLLFATQKISKQPISKAQLYSSSSVLSSGRSIPRFESDIVFDGMPWPQVLALLMLRAPGIKWQRVNGKIYWLWANDRVPVETFIYETGIPFTVNPSTNVCTCAGHGLSDGDMLRLATPDGVMPIGLSIRTTYYVRDKTTDTFKLAESPGGAAVDILDTGLGTITYTQRSNIVMNSVTAQRTDPSRKPSFLVLGYRNKDDDVLAQAWSETRRDDLIDANGGNPIDPGIQQIGVATSSQASRMGEAMVRMASDRDIEVQLKGQKSSHVVAKNDLIRLIHPRGDWRMTPFAEHPDGPILMEVLTETFESTITTANEKSFILRIWYPEYDDTAHGPLFNKPPGYVPTPFEMPPPVTSVVLTERLWQLPDRTYALAIDGLVTFNEAYKFEQQGRVWWRSAADEREFTVTAATDVVSLNAHGYINGTPVMVRSTGSLPGGLDDTSTYFVVNETTNTFKLAKTVGGSALDITSIGTANHFIAPFVQTNQFLTPTATTHQAAFTIQGVSLGNHKVKVVSESRLQRKRAFELHPTWSVEIESPPVPPVATGLTLEADDILITGIIVDFEFSALLFHGFPMEQSASIFLKGPSLTEPSDATYVLMGSATPDANLHGHFEIRAVKGGKYWVKVVTSAFGQSETSGHPIATIDLRAAAVTDVFSRQENDGDWLDQFIGHPRTVERPESYAMEVWASTDRSNPTNRKRTLPIIPGGGHACLLVGTQYGADGTYKNNLYCPTNAETSATTIEQLTDTYTRFDFNIRWRGPNSNCIIPTSPNVFTNISFQGALDRDPNGTELSTWSAALLAAYASGPTAFRAEVKSLLEGLFNSAEYTARGRTDDEFVEDLYNAYLDRRSDTLGKASWLDSITVNGRPYVLDAFGLGSEFNDRMDTIKAADVLTRYVAVGLQTRADSDPVGGVYGPDLSLCPVSIEWDRGTAPGTIKEIVKSFGVVVLPGISADGSVNRDNVDTGFFPAQEGTSQGRPGPRYTIFQSGTEYRVHANYDSDAGKKPIAIIPTPSAGYPFPFRLSAKVRDDEGHLSVENITTGGQGLIPSTIYSAREQIEDFGAIQWGSHHVRIFQVGFNGVDGVPVDIDI